MVRVVAGFRNGENGLGYEAGSLPLIGCMHGQIKKKQIPYFEQLLSITFQFDCMGKSSEISATIIKVIIEYDKYDFY